MAENETTGNCKCAREALGPWLIGIAVLICATLVLTLCYADDMRQAHKTRQAIKQQGPQNRQNPQAAGVTQSPGMLGRLAAFIPPWRSQTQTDSVAVTGASPVAQSFSQAIGIVSPSIVGITTTTTTTTGDIESQSGSGIIVHPMGYILTNHHVIKNVHDITVSVTMGQEPVIRKYLAEVVEIQPQMDLAVIRITDRTGRKFVPAPLGNSDNIMVGQQVAAIGSPFGLTQSASAGIISNCDRTLTAGDKVFTGLIQTDASINPGSSGGALVNETAEVIGINTAIYSLSMGFSGIGFAVPINDAKRVFSPFIKTIESPMLANARMQGARPGIPYAPNTQVGGVNVKMVAGPGQVQPVPEKPKACWLGVDILPVDSTVAREFNVPFNGGVLVNRVFKLSPSDVAGVKRGDVLFRIDGRRISDQDMLWSSLVAKESREPVKLTLFRQGKRMTVTAIMAPEPANVDLLLRQGHIPPGAPPMIGEISWVGIDFQPIEPRRAQQFGIAPNLTGVVIGEVEGIAAIEAGLLPGDVVLYLNSQPVTDIGVLKNIVKNVNPGEGVVLDILRRDQRFYITVQPSPLDMGAWQ